MMLHLGMGRGGVEETNLIPSFAFDASSLGWGGGRGGALKQND